MLVIMKKIGNEKTGLKKGNEICKKYASICSSKGIEASCSCGLKLCKSSDDISMSLIDKADRALYVSKQEGKGHCVIFGEDR